MQSQFAKEHAWDQKYADAVDLWHGQGKAHVAALPLEMAINAARDGDPNAFSALIQHYYTAAVRVARQILKTEEAATDAVQDAIIKAHRAMHRFQDGNFRSWLLRIVTNTCYDYLRRQKRRATVSLDEFYEASNGEEFFWAEPHSMSVDEDPEQVAVSNESMEYLLSAIDELPVWHRSVVLLVDVHGYCYADAAELLKVPVGTVKSRLSRARAELRDQLVRSGAVSNLNMM